MRRGAFGVLVLFVVAGLSACGATGPAPAVAPTATAAADVAPTATATATVADWERGPGSALRASVESASDQVRRSGLDLVAAKPACAALSAAVADALAYDDTAPLPDPQLRTLWRSYLTAAATWASACVAAADARITLNANTPSDPLAAAKARADVADLDVRAASASRDSATRYGEFFDRLLATR